MRGVYRFVTLTRARYNELYIAEQQAEELQNHNDRLRDQISDMERQAETTSTLLEGFKLRLAEVNLLREEAVDDRDAAWRTLDKLQEAVDCAPLDAPYVDVFAYILKEDK